jgi:LPXTG-motif cell wall-anchored protein
MRNRTVTLAAIGTLLVLPMAGGFAQDNGRTTTDMMRDTAKSDTVHVMDVSQFRDTLYRIRELFKDMNREHNQALASSDALIISNHEEDNRAMTRETLGLIQTITRHFSYESLRQQAGMGDDAAFIRVSMWDLANILQGDLLNGRDAYITTAMWTSLDESIHRAENPNFKLAWVPLNMDRLNQPITLSTDQGTTATTTTETTTVAQNPYVPTNRSNYARQDIPPIAERPEVTTQTTTTVAQAPPPTTQESVTQETVAQERMGTSTLPRTGGDPGTFFLFGSSLIGVGSILRRRRRSSLS